MCVYRMWPQGSNVICFPPVINTDRKTVPALGRKEHSELTQLQIPDCTLTQHPRHSNSLWLLNILFYQTERERCVCRYWLGHPQRASATISTLSMGITSRWRCGTPSHVWVSMGYHQADVVFLCQPAYIDKTSSFHVSCFPTQVCVLAPGLVIK